MTNSGNISGNIYKSSDYGATWTDATPSGTGYNLFYTDITTSSDGSVIAATAGSSGIIISRDSGATWQNQTPIGIGYKLSWSAVSISTDGTKIIGLVNNASVYSSNSA